MSERILGQCSWCKAVNETGQREDWEYDPKKREIIRKDYDVISHGMCPPCSDNFTKGIGETESRE